MNVLVACEESQRVVTEFRKLGHNAFSCDIEPCSGGHPEWHILSDALPLIDGQCKFSTMDGTQHEISGKWDLLIAHPPCTYLTSAGSKHFSPKCASAEQIKAREKKRIEAAEFFMRFINADCDRIAVENPVGYMNTHYRKADQIVHPYFFAKSKDDEENYVQKRTCFWLKGLKPLERISNLPKPEPLYISNGTVTKGKGRNWVEGIRGTTGGQKGRAKARSKTFIGIAKAMAEQWSK